MVVGPENVRAQMEGGILMGRTNALKERITIQKGRFQQTNNNNYQLLRMQDIPDKIETYLINSDVHPEGVCEKATPMVAGAIANAFLKLTRKLLRHLPFTPERVLGVLNS